MLTDGTRSSFLLKLRSVIRPTVSCRFCTTQPALYRCNHGVLLSPSQPENILLLA